MLGWHSIRGGISDIRLASIDEDGALSNSFIESIAQTSGGNTVNIDGSFRFARMDGSLNDISNLSILWSESVTNAEGETDRDVLRAVKFVGEGGSLRISAALDIAELPARTLQLTLYNASPATLSGGKNRSVRLGFYDDALFESIQSVTCGMSGVTVNADKTLSVSGEDAPGLIDDGAFTLEVSFDIGQYVTDAGYEEIPDSGVRLYAYGIEPDENPTGNFSDAGNTYYTGYLAAAKRLGITADVGDNMYAPGRDITRQEMFTLLYNALKVIGRLPQSSTDKTLSDYTDAGQIADWAKEAMTLLVRAGTVNGSGKMLSPAGTATRAEMAQILYNLLGK